MDNSCKRRAYCNYRSFVFIHTECGQWQTSFTREKSTCLVEVSVTEQILRKFPEILGELIMRKQCVYQALFSPPTHGSMRTRQTSLMHTHSSSSGTEAIVLDKRVWYSGTGKTIPHQRRSFGANGRTSLAT